MLDDAAFGAATDVTPKFISPADPTARWTGLTAAKLSSPTGPTILSISTTRSSSMLRSPLPSAVFDKSARTDGMFSREDFTYDQEGDLYFCPGGKAGCVA